MTGLRERKKERTRRELTEAAFALFRSKGYEETTVDDIAEVVGVSARTFFRYFDSKEAVLFGDWREQLVELEELMAERPKGEPLMDSVRALALVLAERLEADREQQLFIKTIVASTPSAGNYEASVLLPAYQEVIVRGVAAWTDGDEGAMRPSLAAGVGMVALHEAKRRWIEDPSQSLTKLTDEAFTELAGLFG